MGHQGKGTDAPVPSTYESAQELSRERRHETGTTGNLTGQLDDLYAVDLRRWEVSGMRSISRAMSWIRSGICEMKGQNYVNYA